MKKIIGVLLSLIVLISVTIDGYFLFIKNKLTGSTTATASQDSSSVSTNKTNVKYKNGTYTGSSTSTRWGNVQVQAVITGRKITKVNVLEYPDENGHDKEINDTAIPTYKSETLKSQSANISLVSGASETYKGFKGSLQNALDQAEE